MSLEFGAEASALGNQLSVGIFGLAYDGAFEPLDNDSLILLKIMSELARNPLTGSWSHLLDAICSTPLEQLASRACVVQPRVSAVYTFMTGML